MNKVETFLSTSSWTCPPGVTAIMTWGMGGSASGARRTGSLPTGEVWSGSGTWPTLQLTNVIPDVTYAVTVGEGGAAASTNGTGSMGGTTSLGSSVFYLGGRASFSVATTGVSFNSLGPTPPVSSWMRNSLHIMEGRPFFSPMTQFEASYSLDTDITLPGCGYGLERGSGSLYGSGTDGTWGRGGYGTQGTGSASVGDDGFLEIYYSTKRRLTVLEYTASGDWTCPPGVTHVFVEGYGGGGGASYVGTGSYAVGEGIWGGWGCFPQVVVLPVVPDITYNIIVGAGGSGSQILDSGIPGQDGESTFFGSFGFAGGAGGETGMWGPDKWTKGMTVPGLLGNFPGSGSWYSGMSSPFEFGGEGDWVDGAESPGGGAGLGKGGDGQKPSFADTNGFAGGGGGAGIGLFFPALKDAGNGGNGGIKVGWFE